MAVFDASQNWVILVPPGQAVKKAADDLAACIGLLRGTEGKTPELADSLGAAPPPGVPLIVLNSDSANPDLRGFSWRQGDDRIEIYGQGEGGLCKGIYNFLANLGINWPKPGLTGRAAQKNLRNMPEMKIPAPGNDKSYLIKNTHIDQWRVTQDDDKTPVSIARKRLVIPANNPVVNSRNKRACLLRWAMRNCFDAIVLAFNAPPEIIEEAKTCALEVEAGGWILSSLVPRRLFLFNREIFRMEGGRRRSRVHFCPTNPDTIGVIRSQIQKVSGIVKMADVIHLWPEKGRENIWCACPACRAFTFAEQYHIAVNAAADALAQINPKAVITVCENSEEQGDIQLRSNIFAINPEDLQTLAKD